MTTLALGLSLLNGNKDRELSLIEQIKSAMPTKSYLVINKTLFPLIYPIILMWSKIISVKMWKELLVKNHMKMLNPMLKLKIE